MPAAAGGLGGQIHTVLVFGGESDDDIRKFWIEAICKAYEDVNGMYGPDRITVFMTGTEITQKQLAGAIPDCTIPHAAVRVNEATTDIIRHIRGLGATNVLLLLFGHGSANDGSMGMRPQAWSPRHGDPRTVWKNCMIQMKHRFFSAALLLNNHDAFTLPAAHLKHCEERQAEYDLAHPVVVVEKPVVKG